MRGLHSCGVDGGWGVLLKLLCGGGRGGRDRRMVCGGGGLLSVLILVALWGRHVPFGGLVLFGTRW
jgi:hypothetical protein